MFAIFMHSSMYLSYLDRAINSLQNGIHQPQLLFFFSNVSREQISYSMFCLFAGRPNTRGLFPGCKFSHKERLSHSDIDNFKCRHII